MLEACDVDLELHVGSAARGSAVVNPVGERSRRCGRAAQATRCVLQTPRLLVHQEG